VTAHGGRLAETMQTNFKINKSTTNVIGENNYNLFIKQFVLAFGYVNI